MTTNLAELLDNFLDQAEGLVEQPKQEFIIDNDQRADWAVRRILKLQARNEEIDRVADDRINKTEAWREQLKSENEKSILFLSELLRPYAAQFITKKKKTVKFPSGNVSFRSASVQYSIAGQKADGKNKLLTEYVKTNAPEFLKIEESTKWGDFKETLSVKDNGQVVSADGEILSFMMAAELPDTISVKERHNEGEPVFFQGEPNAYGLAEYGYRRPSR